MTFVFLRKPCLPHDRITFMDDAPGDLEIFPGYQRMVDELQQAEAARSAGNEGKARVCARRAAGIAAAEYLNRLGDPHLGPSAYDRLQYLYEIADLPPYVRMLAGHFLERVNQEFTLPIEMDLIADARQLAAELLGSLPLNNSRFSLARPIKGDSPDIVNTQIQERTMTPSYLLFNNLSLEIPDVPSDSIISRTIYSDDQVKAVLFRFAQGQELSEHTASVPAILHILEGEARLLLGSDSHEAGAGTWAHMQANLPHSIHAKTPTTMLLLMLRQK